jgi:hypothetical protein
MLLRDFGWRRLGVSLILGLVALGARAVADDAFPYVGDDDVLCRSCHTTYKDKTYKGRLDKFTDYLQHGHRWEEVPTGGVPPTVSNPPKPTDNFGFASVKDENGNPVGVPDLATANIVLKSTGAPMQWSDVRAILGNFRDGAGEFVTKNGKLVSPGTAAKPTIWDDTATTASYTKKCFRCHNPTGYSDTPTVDDAGDIDTRTMYGMSVKAWVTKVNGVPDPLFNGAPALDPDGNRIQGVQCEHCHGPAGLMKTLTDDTTPKRVELCRDCHSTNSGDPKPIGDPEHRIPIAPVDDGTGGFFSTITLKGMNSEDRHTKRSGWRCITQTVNR